MHTFWVTFYSYKGGVGRSMALANTAAYLAKMGRRVVMVDFDLEAPGLDSFEEFGVPPGNPGLVEYVCHYMETNQPAPVGDYLCEILPRDPKVPEQPLSNFEGKLWLMPSGAKDLSYNRKRLSINWTDLYESRSGTEFLENFKADIEDTFQPDFVFIDSRTGLTDVGGVCTLHLPDLVILLFALNEQNLQGTASVARVLRESEKLPQLLTVATPVPSLTRESSTLIDQRFLRVKELLGGEAAITLNYRPEVALKEKVFVWADGSSPVLCSQYEALAKELMKADPAGLDFLIREAKAAMETLDLERTTEIKELLQSDYSGRALAWRTIAELARTQGDLGGMETALRRALDLLPTQQTFDRLDTLLRAQKRHEASLELLEKLLRESSNFDTNFEDHLLTVGGELHLRSGRPDLALPFYQKGLERERANPKMDGEPHLATLFNCAESHRRASGQIHSADWDPVIAQYERTAPNVNSMSLAVRANQVQAMHIAYACVKNIERADELLDEAGKLVAQVSKQERIFSVADYEHVPAPRFAERTQQMRDALARNELWDGMKLNGNG